MNLRAVRQRASLLAHFEFAEDSFSLAGLLFIYSEGNDPSFLRPAVRYDVLHVSVSLSTCSYHLSLLPLYGRAPPDTTIHRQLSKFPGEESWG